MEQYFYVLFNTTAGAFYIDNQFGFTNNMLLAEQYESREKAEKELKYFREPENWKVKKVTVRVEL